MTSILPLEDLVGDQPVAFQGASEITFLSTGGQLVQFSNYMGPSNFLGRLKRRLPPWFGDAVTPILDAVLAGPAAVLSFVYELLQYVSLQVRLATTTDGFLDLAAADFFGAGLPRNSGEADAAYLLRFQGAFRAAKNTRPALVAALQALGLGVQLVEPWNPSDTGALNKTLTLAWSGSGVWGSRTMPFQCFVTTTRPAGSAITNAQIFAAIETVRPAGVKVWVKIVG